MTELDDATRLAELGGALPEIDLDRSTAERIARRARGDVGHGPPLRRWLEPVIAGAVATSYLVWAVIKVLEALR